MGGREVPSRTSLLARLEAELATLSTEQRKEEELDEPTEPAQYSLPNSKRMKLSSSSASTSKQVRAFAPQLTKNEMEKLNKSAIPNSTTSDTKYCFKLWNDWYEYRLK